MTYLYICCAFCCFCGTLLLVKNIRVSKKQAATLIKIRKGFSGMKKETVLPLVGKEIQVRDVFDNWEMGRLESVDDDSLTLVSAKRKGEVRKIVALEYVATIEVEK